MEQIVNAQQIISAVIESGATDSKSILDVLCDGAALAAMGITDDDQDAVEEACITVRKQQRAEVFFVISASTDDAEIESAIGYCDMSKEAKERRNDAAAVMDEQGDQKVLEYVEFADGVAVLYSPEFGYAYVNQRSPGVGDSMLIENGGADSADHAAHIWRSKNVIS